jgi:pyruvate dehydrogenase E2 component (dihydrolipoamide acetyltransferase)
MFRIVLARQGQTMEQGTIVRWLVEPGQAMNVGEELYEIETEKTIVPIEATRPGRIVRFVAQPGDTVAVGALLAVAAEPDEAVSDAQVNALLAASSDPGSPGGTAPAATPSPRGAPTPPTRESKIPVSPKARALAAELGVQLAEVTGSGPNGTILPDDIRRAASTMSAASSPGAAVVRRTPLSPIARTIVGALERAWQTPQFTQGILVDATALVEARKSQGDLGFMDYFLDAMVRAAREVPEVLMRIVDHELEHRESIDITVATATDRGLLVPVLRNAGALDLRQRREAWRALVDRARTGKLAADESTGGLLALSNLGTRGVDYGTPLLPVGHSLIVFVGGLATRPFVVDERLEARPTLHVAVTYDHRVVDGVLGSRYTGALKNALLSP